MINQATVFQRKEQVNIFRNTFLKLFWLFSAVPSHQRIDEAGVLLSEFLNIFKEAEMQLVVEQTLTHWISTRRAGIVVFGLMKSVGINVENPNVFGNITEACLESYFDSIGQ